ncbi:hypothetical protein DMUE_1159 [Dictyocoela muelleri]|nr:hypothetical protein DMUE_1159 [Dictyocoela muelleri]
MLLGGNLIPDSTTLLVGSYECCQHVIYGFPFFHPWAKKRKFNLDEKRIFVLDKLIKICTSASLPNSDFYFLTSKRNGILLIHQEMIHNYADTKDEIKRYRCQSRKCQGVIYLKDDKIYKIIAYDRGPMTEKIKKQNTTEDK